MAKWQQHKEAALVDLAAADAGYPDEVYGHLEDALANINKAMQCIEEEADEGSEADDE